YPESESQTFPTVVGGEQTIPYYKGKASTVYGSAKRETYRLSGHLRHRRLGKLRNVGDLGKVYALTGSQAHAERTRVVLLRLAEVYPAYLPHDWNRVYKGYGNLQSGKLSGWKLSDAGVFVQLATAYDLTYNSGVYTDEDKVRIEEGCFREFARLMVATSPRGCCVNDGPTAMAGGALAGLMIGSHETVAWAVEPPDGFLGFLEEYFVRDGHWYEASPSYEGMSVNPLYMTPEALQGYSDPVAYAEEDRYDNLDLYQHPVMRKMMIAGVSEVMPDGCLPPTNDSTWRARFSRRRVAAHAYWYPSEENNRLLSWAYGGSLDGRGDEYALFRRDPSLSDDTIVPATPSEHSVVRPGVGWAILRTGGTRKDAAVFLDYGPKGSGHGHPDRLNIIYYDYGRELVTDLGYLGWGHPNHPWLRSTASHNQVIVDGKPHGAAAGELEAFSGAGAVQGVIASAPRVYPETTSTFRRHLVFVNHGAGHRYLVDLFEVEGGVDHQYAFHGDGETFHAPPLAFTPTDIAALGEPATGYRHMKDVRQASTDESFVCEWVSDPGEHIGVRLHMMGQVGTTLVQASANGLRNRSTPFAKVKMYPILVRRKGPSNRFLAVVEGFRGARETPLQVRRLRAESAKGWAEAVEVVGDGRRDVVVCASADAAAAGVSLPEFPQIRCHARLALFGRRDGVVEILWALGGSGVAFGDAVLEIVPPVSGRVTQADDDGDTVIVDAHIDDAWRGRDRQLLITGDSRGAYAVRGASVKGGATEVALADEPILGVSSGDAFTVVPAGSWERILPQAVRVQGAVRGLRVPAEEAGRAFARDGGGGTWRELPKAAEGGTLALRVDALSAQGDTWVVVGAESPANDQDAPLVEAVHDAKGTALQQPDAGYQPKLRDIVLTIVEASLLIREQIGVSLRGAHSDDAAVSWDLSGGDGRWKIAVRLPAQLAEDSYVLALSITDRALNHCTSEVRFNTVGFVHPFRDLKVSGSSGAVVKYFTALDTRFYRSAKPGDWVAFDFDVAIAGRYRVELVYTQYNSYGIVQASLDGAPLGAPVDLYGRDLRGGGGMADFGELELEAGRHVFRLDVTSRNPSSSNYFIGVRELHLKPCGK
ncbi:MAG: heparinase II/III family protein, partial [Lentisphaeria bacterium]|nr:heparinase II/III family protein [Lentisphaeria bacterium]